MEFILLGVGLSLLTQIGIMSGAAEYDLALLPLLVFALCIFWGLIRTRRVAESKPAPLSMSLPFAQRIQMRWTLFLVQSKKIRELKSRVTALETENTQLLQDLNGFQELWLRNSAPNEKSIPRNAAASTPAPAVTIAETAPPATSQYFNDQFFDLHIHSPVAAEKNHSHSISDKAPEDPFL